MTETSMIASDRRIVSVRTPSVSIAPSRTPMAGIFSAENRAAVTPRAMER